MISTIAKILLALYCLSSYKSLPLAYYFRFYTVVIKNIVIPQYVSKRKSQAMRTLDKNANRAAFFHAELKTYNSPFETDFYLHKSNSTYFAEFDIARTDLMTKVFQKLFLNSKRWPYVPVANVFTNFLKEIKPFQKYEIRTQILCWDEKWIYVFSRVYIDKFNKESKKMDKVLASISLTKYVLKDGRITIKPKEALEKCGYYNEEVAAISAANLKVLEQECGFHNTKPLEEIDHFYGVV